jgi:hypothetical protein
MHEWMTMLQESTRRSESIRVTAQSAVVNVCLFVRPTRSSTLQNTLFPNTCLTKHIGQYTPYNCNARSPCQWVLKASMGSSTNAFFRLVPPPLLLVPHTLTCLTNSPVLKKGSLLQRQEITLAQADGRAQRS